MTQSPLPILCIGGATLDRTYLCTHPPALGTSNPVAARTSYGGVARNVAESLGRLGAIVRLISAVGADSAGGKLNEELAGAGVDASGVMAPFNQGTAEYTAAFWQGELFAGFADMDIFDTLTPQAVAAKLPNDHDKWQVFADCNLPAETLAMLASKGLPHLAADCVSLAKAERLPPDLSGFAVLFLNTDQAAHLGGIERVLARGCRTAILTQGKRGVMLFEGVNHTHLAAPNVSVKNVSGAGDALIAGTLLGLSEHLPLLEAVRHGLAATALALQTLSSVPEYLTRQKLKAALTGIPDAN